MCDGKALMEDFEIKIFNESEKCFLKKSRDLYLKK